MKRWRSATHEINLPTRGQIYLQVSPVMVFITTSKTRDDLLIRCKATEETINAMLEAGDSLAEIARHYVGVRKDGEKLPEWDDVKHGYHYRSFEDAIGKALIAAGANITEEK
jgi:hypothetical protein